MVKKLFFRCMAAVALTACTTLWPTTAMAQSEPRTQPQRFTTAVNLADLIQGDTLMQGYSIVFDQSSGQDLQRLTLSAGRYYVNAMGGIVPTDPMNFTVSNANDMSYTDTCGIAMGAIVWYPYTGTELGDAWVVTSATDEDALGGATIRVVTLAGIQMPPIIWISGSCAAVFREGRGALNVFPIDGHSGAMADYTNATDRPWHNVRNNIRSLVVADGVTHVGKYAFFNCQKLASITLGNSVVSLGESSFAQCQSTKLTSIELPASLKTIGARAFYINRFTSITFPNGIDTIGQQAFGVSANLTSITFGDTVGVIGNYAFQSCTKLTSVDINYVKTIGMSAFASCNKVEAININAAQSIGNSAFQAAAQYAGAIHIGKVDTIYQDAFFPCPKDTVLTIDSVGFIANSNFGVMQKLTELEIGHVDSISYSCFNACQLLTKITLPEGLTYIGQSSFVNGLVLDTIYLPSTLITIGDNVFAGCSAVKDIFLPVDPDNLTWGNTNNCFKSDKGTICHVPANKINEYNQKFSSVNVTFVGDIPAPFTVGDIPANWTVTSDDETVTVQNGTATIMSSSVVVLTPDHPERVKSVRLIDDVPPTITVDGLELNGQDGDSWETIVANNPTLIEISGGFVSRLPGGENLMNGECGGSSTNPVMSSSTYNASWADEYHWCGD